MAFERPAGPGRLLERDQRVIEVWRARLPASRALWEQAAERVFADVVATTPLRWEWGIAVHEDEEVWTEPPAGLRGQTGLHVWRSTHKAGWEPPRRPLLLPQLWFEVHSWGRLLSPEPVDLHEAAAELADYVQEQVMDDVWSAWPPRPGHGHPLQVGGGESEALWVCPGDGRVIAQIGALHLG